LVSREWARALFALAIGCTALGIRTAGTVGWTDSSRHRVHFVEVEPGVKLEVLDWGGRGQPLLLLAGHGHTAHVFDDFATHLVTRFHVLALTRRGFGASSQPDHGYDLTTMTQDVAHVVDNLGLGRVHLAGHSIAGDEMTRFAVSFPHRVATLTYLEAAYDRVETQRVEKTFPKLSAPEAPTADDLRSPVTIRSYLARSEILLPEAEIRATRVFDADGRFIRDVTPDRILDAVARMVEHPDYMAIRSPMLSIYAVYTGPTQLIPRYVDAEPSTRATIDTIFGIWQSAARAQRDLFRRRVPMARVVEIEGASHYVFISHQALVLGAMQEFLSTH
jgi:pimeloyl-ACP methyl ester carboxylesterase